jgi:hypothetical protein
MADLAAKEAARNIDEAGVTLTHGDVPWYDKTRPFTQNDERQGRRRVAAGRRVRTPLGHLSTGMAAWAV